MVSQNNTCMARDASLPTASLDRSSPRRRRPTAPAPARAPPSLLRSRSRRRVRRPPPSQGTKRFYTPEIKEHVEEYNKAWPTPRRAQAGANRLFARFSTHFPLWRAPSPPPPSSTAARSLAKVSAGPGTVPPRLVDQPGPFQRFRAASTRASPTPSRGATRSRTTLPSGGEAGAAAEEEAPDASGDGSEHGRQIDAVAAGVPLRAPRAARLPRHGGRVRALAGRSDARASARTTRSWRGSRLSVWNSMRRRSSSSTRPRSGVDPRRARPRHATFDGMAIAHAVLDHLVKVTKCRALFATHYHALTRVRAAERRRRAVPHGVRRRRRDARRHVPVQVHHRRVQPLARRPRRAPRRPPRRALLAAAEQKSKAMEASARREVKTQLARRLLALPEKVSADEARELCTVFARAMLREPAA